MSEPIQDAIRHLEKDLSDVLTLLTDKDVNEIILNPYRLSNGGYEGHILIDKVGVGLQDLIIAEETEIFPQQASIDDQLIVKYDKDTKDILFWVKIDHKLSLDQLIYLCICRVFHNDKILETSNPKITELATDVANRNITNKKALDLNELFEKLESELFEHQPFGLKTVVVNTNNLSDFVPYPNKLVKEKLVKMSAAKAETIMSVLASITGKFIHNKNPILECQIPKYGHRFTGVIPPASTFPAFCIRKHASKIYTLRDFVDQGIMQESSYETIVSWIKRKFNILIAGGTGSGKTTLANAILHEVCQLFPETRMLIIEDVPELQFNTSRSIAFSVGEFFSMYDALRTTLRFKPNRIIMGEVRGMEAYTLLKAWNTGHPGGLATIHANGVNEALYRFESCIRDHPGVKINRQEIGFTINGIISIQNLTIREKINGQYQNTVKRKITALRQIMQYDPDKDVYQDVIFDRLEESFE